MVYGCFQEENNMDKGLAMLIVNPSSGTERSTSYQEDVLQILKEQGYETTLRLTEKAMDAARFAEEACEDTYELVVAMGGDGTISEVINGLAEKPHRPRFGFIPLGTVNDFARSLSIPLEPEKAISVIRNSENVKKVDVGKVNDAYFANVIAVGALAEATFSVPPEKKTKLGTFAYVLEGAKSLAADSAFDIQITCKGRTERMQAMLVLVAMTNSVGGFEKLAEGAEADDGNMHIFAVPDLSVLQVINILSTTLRGDLMKSSKVAYMKATEAVLTTESAMTANVDGDEGHSLPLKISVLPEHLEVIVP